MNLALKTCTILVLTAFCLGCGYSKPAMNTGMPAIAQLSPSSATAGGAEFQLEVDGTNFTSNAVINFNGVAQPTKVVSSTKAEAMIPPAAITNSGMVPVTVTDPATTGIYGTGAVTSAPMSFTVN